MQLTSDEIKWIYANRAMVLQFLEKREKSLIDTVLNETPSTERDAKLLVVKDIRAWMQTIRDIERQMNTPQEKKDVA